jgi:hypothetical protein
MGGQCSGCAINEKSTQNFEKAQRRMSFGRHRSRWGNKIEADLKAVGMRVRNGFTWKACEKPNNCLV